MSIDDVVPSGRSTQADRSGNTADLRGSLGTASLIMTVIAYQGPIIILAGLVPLIIGLGNGLGAPATFVTLGVLVAVFAVGINAMASRMTHAGAFYTYVTAGLGRPPGLAAGGVAIVAYLTLGVGCQVLFGVSFAGFLESVLGIENGPPWQVWTLIAWAVLSGLSLFNIDLSAKVVGAFSCAEIAVALIWNGGVYLNGGPEGRSVDVVSSFFDDKLPYALVLGIITLTGFESLQVFRAETKDPLRTVPRATYATLAIATALYSVSAYAFIVAYGPSKAAEVGAADPVGSFLASVTTYASKPVGDIANILLTTSTFAAALALQSILARYLYSLGKDGVLPAVIGRPNTKHGSPMNAAALAAGAALLLIAFPAVGALPANGAFATFTGLGGFCLVLLYFATSIAIVTFFAKRRADRGNAVKTIVAPVVSCIGMGVIVYLSLLHIQEVLVASQTVANVVLVLVAGIIVAGWGAALWFRRHNPDVYERIGRQSETIEL
jgi:amino acid transporter